MLLFCQKPTNYPTLVSKISSLSTTRIQYPQGCETRVGTSPRGYHEGGRPLPMSKLQQSDGIIRSMLETLPRGRCSSMNHVRRPACRRALCPSPFVLGRDVGRYRVVSQRWEQDRGLSVWRSTAFCAPCLRTRPQHVCKSQIVRLSLLGRYLLVLCSSSIPVTNCLVF